MILSLLIFLFSAVGSRAACLPDDLVIETELTSYKMKLLEDTVRIFESTMVRKLPTDHDLVIRLEVLNPRVNAEVLNENGHVAIVVWGGMLSHPKMNQATLYLLLCHELGHLLGGPPLKSRTGWSSTEGQSDYYSTSSCLKDLGINEDQFVSSAIALTSIYAEVVRQEPPRLDRCDETVVTRINYSYPRVQCRLDTLLAGWRELPRPKCWFLE